jgi:hypothetical protein
MTKETKKLNELIQNDKELSHSLDELALNLNGSDDNYEDEFSITELQIINKILKYHGYEPIFDFIDEPSHKLIYQYLNDFAEKHLNDFDLSYGNHEIAFRTDDAGDQCIRPLLERDIKATGMYVIPDGPNGSTVMAEIEFNKFDENKDSISTYLENTVSKIYEAIEESLLDFDADEEFDQLWHRNSGFSAREFLRILDEDEDHFRKAAAYM